MLDKLKADLTAAMKRRDALATSVLRMLMADCKNALVAGEKRDTLADEEVLAIIQRGVKRRRDSIEQFEQSGRTDLADKEKAEMAVLEAYLPKQLSEEQIATIVDQAIADTGAETMRDMGKVMKQVMGEHKSEVDGKTVKKLVSERLA